MCDQILFKSTMMHKGAKKYQLSEHLRFLLETRIVYFAVRPWTVQIFFAHTLSPSLIKLTNWTTKNDFAILEL